MTGNAMTIVKRMKKTLSDEKSWTKKCFARDMDGNPVRESSRSADSFCLMGAMRKSSRFISYYTREQVYRFMYDEVRKLGFDSVHTFNDSPKTSFDDVKSFLEKLERRVNDIK